MPGKNCAFPGCGVSCSRKYKGISIFQIPMRNDEFHSNWRKEIVNVLFKYRVADKELKDRVAVGKIYICERHFSTDDIELTKNKRKTLKLLAIPTKNLPKKSHKKSQHPGRKHQHIVQDRASDKILNSKCFKSFLEFKNRANKLKLTDNWMVTHHEKTTSFKKFTKPFLVPTYEIIVDESLVYSCVVLGWVLQSDDYFIKQYLGSVKNVFISDLITEIENFKVCLGLTNITSSELICHYVSTEISSTGLQAGLSVHKHYLRPKNCDILCSLLSENNICSKCSNFEKKFYKQLAQKNKTSTVPAKKNAPLKSTHPNKIILALKEKRLECKELTKTIEKIKNEIVSKSIAVSSNISDEVFEIMRLDNNEVSPFMKMLWKQQQKFFSNPTSKMRYHPMIIRFCLS
ncbi:uncharacterized protein LOC136076375 [Hydra vulgaris]|uniref:Uncharacterized protein LOC136076375 n=1 Tax=Hydra vulgaris TaxID=6087 RepID=A0ABM4BAI2_HYDVU